MQFKPYCRQNLTATSIAQNISKPIQPFFVKDENRFVFEFILVNK